MSRFEKKLCNYISENFYNPEIAPHFKYGETTYIDSEIAFEIASVFQHLAAIQELWEKEKDYNRLLRKENSELKEEIQFYHENYNCEEDEGEDSTLNEKKEKEYLS